MVALLISSVTATERDVIKVLWILLWFGRGLVPCWSCSMASLSKPKPIDGGIFPFLEDRPSQSSEAALFLLFGEGILGPFPPPSSGEERSISPDSVSDLPPEPGSSWVFSPSPAGAWYGAETSILVNTGVAESSGRGAGHLICSTFFIQP